jgi:chemotaxis protein histidine kinase CheA
MTKTCNRTDSVTDLDDTLSGVSRCRTWAARLMGAVLSLLLVVSNVGCTSSLTAIALRDAMREIAEYGRRGDEAAETTDAELLAEDEEPLDMMSLEEALDSAITRLAAVGRLDAEARQMLLETLDSTNQRDWAVVIESFASTLEERAEGENAIEAVAEQLAVDVTVDAEPAQEVASSDTDTEEPAAAELIADSADAPGVLSEEETPETEVPADVAQVAMASAEAAEAPVVVAAVDLAQLPDAVDEATEVEATAVAATTPAVPSVPSESSTPAVVAEAQPVSAATLAEPTEDTLVEEASPGLLADRVTAAIRELPVSEEATVSPEETMRRLEEALALARRQAPLRVDNPCFAWQVRAWGDVVRCDISRFHIGQQIIVYFEVDNLTSDVGPDGHATKLDTQLKLVNASGECLHEWKFPPLAESCPAPRRDYFARYILQVPEGISPGPLRLEMTVNDLLGEKSTDLALPLEVIGEPELPGERVASDSTFLR